MEKNFDNIHYAKEKCREMGTPLRFVCAAKSFAVRRNFFHSVFLLMKFVLNLEYMIFWLLYSPKYPESM